MIRSIVTATAACAAAAVMVGAAVPALAQGNEPAMTYNAKSHEYCASKEAITGSLIPAAECHTAAVWADEGLVIHARTQVAQR